MFTPIEDWTPPVVPPVFEKKVLTIFKFHGKVICRKSSYAHYGDRDQSVSVLSV